MKSKIPFRAIHVGEILSDELKSFHMSQAEFSRRSGLSKVILNEIIKGKRGITPQYAILFEHYLGVNAEFWMRVQANFEIDKARIKMRKNKTLTP